WRDFLAALPVVVGVTFKAARLGVVRTGGVAGLAGGDSRQKDVARFATGQCLFMTTDAGEPAMRVVVEFCVGHPAKRGVGVLDARQSRAAGCWCVDAAGSGDFRVTR